MPELSPKELTQKGPNRAPWAQDCSAHVFVPGPREEPWEVPGKRKGS